MYIKKGKTISCNLIYNLLIKISKNQIESVVSNRIFDKVKNEQLRITENILHPIFFSVVREVVTPFVSSTGLLNH